MFEGIQILFHAFLRHTSVFNFLYQHIVIMAKIIDDETMENVCILSKLSLSEEEKEKAKAEMQKMLDYVEKLDELDTSEVEPMSHIFQDENVFREDVVTNGDNKEAMLANAPKAKEGQYQVPKTIG